MPGKHKNLIRRCGHGAAAVTLNSDCVEVILFGGQIGIGASNIADPVVLRFGTCIRLLGTEVIRMTVE